MRVLVTGGGGFLGGRLARRLLALGGQVAVYGRRRYPSLPAGIEQVQGDLRDLETLSKAIQGRVTVFHAGAITGIWGSRREFESINVQGTQNVVDACLRAGVSRLIHTSSPSVVFGDKDLMGVDESVPYPKTYRCHYPRTKAEAERRVLAAHGQQGLLTAALRPHLIWGPEDPHLLPRLVDRARRGRLVRVGDGANRVDITYIDNAVEGHIRAMEALQPGSPAGGRPYFLSDGEPVVLWDWINRLLAAAGIAEVTRSISYRTARILGGVLEAVYAGLRLRQEPPMTPFLAGQLAASHYFNISAARKDLGYHPVVTPETAWERTLQWLKARPTG
ncbi:MAG: NAD-dependent epimerase/dehydratase family protein [Nitrospinaceae bacterium]